MKYISGWEKAALINSQTKAYITSTVFLFLLMHH